VALSAGPLAEAVQKLTEGRGADLVLDPIGGEVGYSAGMTLTVNSLDFIRNASTILGFNIFLQTPERLGKDHDEVIALAAAKKYRAFVDKTFPAAEVAEATRHLESRKGAGKVVLTF
jgi:NADPH:quinone reductase